MDYLLGAPCLPSALQLTWWNFALQVADALRLDEALPVAAERLKEQRDISVRNVNAWMEDMRSDLARYRANSSTSLKVCCAT